MKHNLFVLSFEPSPRPGYEIARLGPAPDGPEWIAVTYPAPVGERTLKVGDTVPPRLDRIELMRSYRVGYPRREWSRDEAWRHLKRQQIPGCPDREVTELDETGEAIDRRWWNFWRRAHTKTEWGWVYESAAMPALEESAA